MPRKLKGGNDTTTNMIANDPVAQLNNQLRQYESSPLNENNIGSVSAHHHQISGLIKDMKDMNHNDLYGPTIKKYTALKDRLYKIGKKLNK